MTRDHALLPLVLLLIIAVTAVARYVIREHREARDVLEFLEQKGICRGRHGWRTALSGLVRRLGGEPGMRFLSVEALHVGRALIRLANMAVEGTSTACDSC